MLFSTPLLLLASFTTSTLAFPLLTTRQTGTWTITKFTRTCNDASNTCSYAFGINTNDNTVPTTCAYVVVGPTGPNAPSAREQSYNSIACGVFSIGSTWSGQFGAGNGFQTLSVVTAGKIVYPGYTDSELVDGVTVSPDKSFPVNALPGSKFVAPSAMGKSTQVE